MAYEQEQARLAEEQRIREEQMIYAENQEAMRIA